MKTKEIYVCKNCGYETPKWNGRCPGCGEWNTFEQVIMQKAAPSKAPANTSAAAVPQPINEIDINNEVRYKTGLKELDRVLGGGIVAGSLVLLGGDPGIGKSTLLLQICQFLAQELKVLYISGEESIKQIKLRANRLGVTDSNIFIVSQTDMGTIINTITAHSPDLVIVDSIQTVSISEIASSPGSVTQVRECTGALQHIAKSYDIPIFIVGHVNKDGNIAGPKVLEHIVDAVLYFEGERQLSYRILRAVKNRYGSTNEIGVFEMGDKGLNQVENPSLMLLSGRPLNVSGSCVACVMEGTRPIMAEVQALVSKTGFGTPRRMATGFDYNRTALLLAVLEKRAGFFFGSLDTYINVVGGLKLDEPSADLAVTLALISSLTDKPINEGVVAFGEVGLGGEIRAVSHILPRIKEAERLGFTKCIIPHQSLAGLNISDFTIEICGVSTLRQAIKNI